ncbi:MAG: histone deacetylase [Lewinellaceae bacterium]|nr:histone deacetylase [Saprospiraceae bacterium]MCB9345782.1 histone deacetylase [Lewinellaceae bacterium]
MLKVAYSPIYKFRLPAGHRFPMEKYDLLAEQLLWEGTLREENLFHPEMLQTETALLTHTEDWWTRMNELRLTEREIRTIGFPINETFVRRGRHISQGTLECALYALQYGCSMNIAGGTHHAFADRGEGFCCFNDQAVAANYLLENDLVKRILIIDLDVHQGNGTASIFSNEPKVFTFSMHGEKNYPLRKEKSDLDINLPDGMDDDAYLKTLNNHLPRVTEAFQPDFIFYLSGVDVLETDKLGRLALSRDGCRRRDKTVLEFCKRNQLPVAVSMGGGYSPKIADIVEAHANTFREAMQVFF